MIALKPVNGSSQIAAQGYDPVSRTLAVHFKHGNAVYHYLGVPPEEADRFAKAESPGKHLHAHIKGHYHYERQAGA